MIYHWLINHSGDIGDIILYLIVFMTIVVLIKSKYIPTVMELLKKYKSLTLKVSKMIISME